MSDNDLIRREDALNACYDGWNYDDETIKHIHGNITKIPAVPQEMSAREYFKQTRRLQKWAGQLQQQYRKANETLYKVTDGDIDSSIEVVEKWAREHPEVSE